MSSDEPPGSKNNGSLREGRPYELRDTQGKPITMKGALELIRSEHKVPEETRQARRRRKLNEGRLTSSREGEAAKVPQTGLLTPPLRTVYRSKDLQSTAN